MTGLSVLPGFAPGCHFAGRIGKGVAEMQKNRAAALSGQMAQGPEVLPTLEEASITLERQSQGLPCSAVL